MPTLHLRGLASDLVARVKAYARERDLSLPEAAAHLLESGLSTTAARSAGGHARHARLSAEERRDIARRAARARWADHP